MNVIEVLKDALTRPAKPPAPKVHTHAQEKARTLRQVGFAHNLAQSKALEAKCAAFRERKAERLRLEEERRKELEPDWPCPHHDAPEFGCEPCADEVERRP